MQNFHKEKYWDELMGIAHQLIPNQSLDQAFSEIISTTRTETTEPGARKDPSQSQGTENPNRQASQLEKTPRREPRNQQPEPRNPKNRNQKHQPTEEPESSQQDTPWQERKPKGHPPPPPQRRKRQNGQRNHPAPQT